MAILYKKEHLRCVNYDNSNTAMIEAQTVKKGERVDMDRVFDKLIVVIEGRISANVDNIKKFTVGRDRMFLILQDQVADIIADTDTSILLFRLSGKPQFCSCYTSELLADDSASTIASSDDEASDFSSVTEQYQLAVNPIMRRYMELLWICMVEGMLCKTFFENKSKELFYMFRGFYRKRDIYRLFEPLLSTDLSFSSFVMQNHYKYKSVSELADAMNCSVSTLEKRFKAVFGVYAYSWMKDRRAERVLAAIANPNKSFKEISDEFEFSSQSYFSGFCRNEFGDTPSNIRKDILKNGASAKAYRRETSGTLIN